MKCLDSSFLGDYLRGRGVAARFIEATGEDAFVVPSVVLYELYSGARNQGRDPHEVDDALSWTDTLPFEPSHAAEASAIRTELREAGRRISEPDTMIAGAARVVGAPLVTGDSDFDRVDGLAVENHREQFGN